MYSKYVWIIEGLTRRMSPPTTLPLSILQECFIFALAPFGLVSR